MQCSRDTDKIPDTRSLPRAVVTVLPVILRSGMLVLTRKVGESFVIGDNITVTVVRVVGGGVRIGIEAPDDYMVMRQELRELLKSGELSTVEPTEED